MKPVNMKNDVFENSLTRILSELNGLQILLDKEKELLAESDFDNITEVAEQKKQIITKIEVDNINFKNVLESNNYFNTDQSIHDIIADNVPSCKSLWIEIESLLKICKDKNSINGIVLSNNRRQIQESIAILQGQTNEVLTYGATGESVVTRSTTDSTLSV